jgi:hypothetical protein
LERGAKKMMHAGDVASRVSVEFNTKIVSYYDDTLLFFTDDNIDEMVKFVKNLNSSINVRQVKDGEYFKLPAPTFDEGL